MNKTEVSMILSGVTGRLLCANVLEFQGWATKRLNREIKNLHHLTPFEIENTVTDDEWHEIAEFFITPEMEDSAVKKE